MMWCVQPLVMREVVVFMAIHVTGIVDRVT